MRRDVEGRPDRLRGLAQLLTTVEQAITDGLPLVKVGDPVFFEPLAVAFDKAGPDAVRLRGRASTRSSRRCTTTGRLTAMSEKWFGLDLTEKPGRLTPT